VQGIDIGRKALYAGLLLIAAACGERTEPQGGPPPSPSSPTPRIGGEPDLAPPTALWQQVENLRADRQAPRHPSDGGGHARLELVPGERAQVQVQAAATWRIVYTAGELGIREGGNLQFMPEPFWGWSPPQARDASLPGYTTVETDAEGVELELGELRRVGTATFVATVRGRALAAGEELRIVYGAGRLGAFADRHAERGARLWIFVDGDGDGARQVLADSPSVEVLPASARRVVLHGPSVARPGETVRFTLALLDALANVVPEAEAEIALSGAPEGWTLPPDVKVEPSGGGTAEFSVVAAGPAVARLVATTTLEGEEVRAEANPLWVADGIPRIRWGDLHGHSNYSDGSGHPEQWWHYARDVAALDVAALTDHDHFGIRFLDQNPELWEELRAAARAMDEPGRFVALLGYEWTNWVHGHRHVLYFGEDGAGELLSSLDPAYETPDQLWAALRDRPALTVAHHSAGSPIPVNWTFLPPRDVEPVTEVMSVHGSSEAADSPRLLRGARRGYFVRDVLDHGVPLGFVASGDGHDGHPGLAHLSPVYGWRPTGRREPGPFMGTGGVAGILCEELDRSAVLDALRARRCYATSGPRILLHVSLAGYPMGSDVPLEALGEAPVALVIVLGTAGLDAVELVRRGRVERVELDGERHLSAELPVAGLEQGDYVYLRVLQSDGALAWSSPWFVE